MKTIVRLFFLSFALAVAVAASQFPFSFWKTPTSVGPTWYDVEIAANANANKNGDANSIRWSVVTVAQAGTSTQFRVYQRNQYGGSETVKVALYNGTALIAQGTVVFSSGGVPVYRTANWNSSVAVVAQNYNLMISYVGSNGEMGINSGAGTYSENSSTSYAAAPPATLPSATTTPGGKFCMGIYVQ